MGLVCCPCPVIVILHCGLVSLCPCAMIWYCVGVWAVVPVLYCGRLALCVVLSIGYILLKAAGACVNRV